MLVILQVAAYKKVLIGCVLVGFFTTLVYYNGPLGANNIILYSTPETEYDMVHFLVSSSKCKMSNLQPFNDDAKKFFKPEKYYSCSKHDLLTYTTVEDNIAKLHIDYEIAPSYASNISCCFSNVTRKPSKLSPDSNVEISKCVPFVDNTTIHTDTVLVRCHNAFSTNQIYENVHAVITADEEVQKKMLSKDTNSNLSSILFVGIDSISRLNLIRTMPLTFKYLEENEWLPLVGYNKMDDNTFPNLMAILTGMNQSRQYDICKPKSVGNLDNCPLLIFDYRNAGYITAYAEDEATISTFNYKKKGFTKPPTNYYFRPYMIASEKLTIVTKDNMKFCTGPISSGERILNLAKDFSNKFKEYAHFGFFWMNSFSHNKLNSPSRMDGQIKRFFEDLSDNGILNNDIIVFLSDHGMRFGKIRLTYTGWLEERLPFIYFWFPPWFREKFSTEYQNFRKNRNKLTSPYDVYMTLQHLLVLSGVNRTIMPSEGCPKCKTLLGEIESERSCEDVGVVPHWCTCAGYKAVDLSTKTAKTIGKFVVSQINELLNSYNDTTCAQYSVKKVLSTSLSDSLPYMTAKYVLIRIETSPKAQFETTIKYKGDISNDKSYEITGDISRLDLYAPHSYCVTDAYLKKYCYCI